MEHIELLNAIIQVEQQARTMAEEAQEQKRQLPVELNESRQEIHDRYFQKARHRVSLVKEQEEDALHEQLDALDAALARNRDDLKRRYEQNRSQWADTLFSLVVNHAD